MKRFLVIAFLLSAIGCTNNRWGLLYDGRYASSERVQAYAKEHGLTYKEAERKLNVEENRMWAQINQRQQKEPAYKQPPAGAVEAKQVEPIL